MKLCVIMQKDSQYNIYTFKGPNDWRFHPILQIFSDDFNSGQLINWLNDEKKSTGNESVSIDKEDGVIALYDVSASMDETYTGDLIDPEKRFEMTVENFRDVVEKWEELRVSKPDIILLVIHEDNHVSLETDPKTIQEYQDAGYAFDVDRKYYEA